MEIRIAKYRNRLYGLIVAVSASVLWMAIMAVNKRGYGVYSFRVEPMDIGNFPRLIVPYLIGTVITAMMMAMLVKFRSRSNALRRLAISSLPLLTLTPLMYRSFFLEGLLFSLAAGFSMALLILQYGKPKPPLANPVDDSKLHRKELRMSWLAVVLLSTVVCYLIFAYQYQQFQLMRIGRYDLDSHYLRLKNTGDGIAFLEYLPNYPLFYDHFNIGLLIFLPLYWIIPHISMMFIAQSLSFACVGIVMFMYCRKVLKSNISAICCAAMTLFHPSVSQMGYNFSYGYQPNSTALPLILLSACFWLDRRYVLCLCTALLACLMKETHAMFFVGMGCVELIWRAKSRTTVRPPLMMILTSGLFFVVVVRLILPQFHHTAYAMSQYAHLGNSIPEVVTYLVTNPGFTLDALFSTRVLNFLALTVGSLAFLPFFAIRQVLYGSISLIGTIFMNYDDTLRICFWHQVDFLAAVFIALPHGVAVFRAFSKGWLAGGNVRCLGLAGLVVTLMMTAFYGLLPFSKNTLPFHMQGERPPEYRREAFIVHELARRIPDDLAILTTDRVLTAFLDFKRIESVGELGTNELTYRDMDLVILDFTDVGWTHSYEKIVDIANQYRALGSYKMFRYEYFTILVSKSAADRINWDNL